MKLGQPDTTARPFANFGDERLPERFWDKCYPCPMSGCWIWFASMTAEGYAQLSMKVGSRRMPRTGHRISFETLVGPVAPGLHLDHLCRTRCCVNPAHLEVVTQGENMRRGIIWLRRSEVVLARTHCKRGHEYTPKNTYIAKDGARTCRECKQVSKRRCAERNLEAA